MVDPLGLTIFLIGLALLIAELASPGYFLGVPGTTGVIIGLIQMAWPSFILGSWWSPIVVVIIATASFFASLEFYRRFAPPIKAPETFSSDTLVGMTGKVVKRIEPNSLSGKAKVGSIVWSATSPDAIDEGADIVVTQVDGVHLIVARTGAPPRAA